MISQRQDDDVEGDLKVTFQPDRSPEGEAAAVSRVYKQLVVE
jgi:hypothetical protein